MNADFEKLIHVPFKGGGGGRGSCVRQVDFSFQNLCRLRKIGCRSIKALVVTTPNRQKIIPDVPTAQEVGYQNIEMVVGWSAVYGPPGLPQDVISKWTDTLQKMKKDRAGTR